MVVKENIMSKTFIKRFSGDTDFDAIKAANDYAEKEGFEMISVHAEHIGMFCNLLVIFRM